MTVYALGRSVQDLKINSTAHTRQIEYETGKYAIVRNEQWMLALVRIDPRTDPPIQVLHKRYIYR